jgi:hypothetical protein
MAEYSFIKDREGKLNFIGLINTMRDTKGEDVKMEGISCGVNEIFDVEYRKSGVGILICKFKKK